MSNIFLATSFVYLAEEEAGCLDEEGEVIDDCDGEAYGFQPATFVSNIAVISSVLAALFMPVIGAMVDYTKHRKTVGMVASALMILIHGIEIETVSKTWLPMVVLQAISGFLYQALILSVFAYLPDLSYQIGEATMTKCEYRNAGLDSYFAQIKQFLTFYYLLPRNQSRPNLSCHNSLHRLSL